MTNKFKEVIFETLYAEPSRNGLTKPRSVRGKGYKMINMGELFAYGRINNPKMDLVPLNDNEIKNTQIQEGDLLFARQSLIASGAGKCSIVLKCPEITTFESHLIRVRLNKEFCNPLFYYYYFSSPVGIEKTQSLVSQVAAAGIRGSELAKLNIHYIDLKIQDKIAKILSNYDDLIENNNKRIKILEEMAQKIYKEWFVDFKFPGHNDSTFKDSTLGKIPSEWKIGIIKDINDVKGGYAYKSNNLKETGKYRIIKIKNIQLGNIDIENCQYIDDDIASKTIAFKLNEGDILIAMTGAQVGKVGIMPQTKQACYLNQRVGKFIPNKPFVFNNQYLSIYTQLEKFNTQINNIASGAAQPNISTSQIENIEILIPNDEIITKFEKTVDPLFKETQTLKNKNQTLKQTRDLLLPRLISGEITVKNMEIM